MISPQRVRRAVLVDVARRDYPKGWATPEVPGGLSAVEPSPLHPYALIGLGALLALLVVAGLLVAASLA